MIAPRSPSVATTGTPRAVDLRRAVLAALQAEGATDPRFHFRPTSTGFTTSNGPGGIVAGFGSIGIAADFAVDGVRLRADRVDGRLRVSATRCDDVPFEAEALGPLRHENARPNRVTLAHRAPPGQAVAEWYLHGPAGLEQGFDIDAPGCTESFAVEVSLDGLTAVRGPGGVELRGASGGGLAYGDAHATDAAGYEVPLTLEVSKNSITLRASVAGVAWPVTIDPLIATLHPEGEGGDGTDWDRFGIHLALDGDTAVVGAPLHDETVDIRGAAYIFRHSAGTWTLEDRLGPDLDRSASEFGESVAISGDTVFVGAASLYDLADDVVYVYDRIGSAWSPSTVLADPTGLWLTGFGREIALDGDTALIGAYRGHDPDVGAPPGRSVRDPVYVYRRLGGIWVQTQRIDAPAGPYHCAFGTSLALRETTALIGDPQDPDRPDCQGDGVAVFTAIDGVFDRQPPMRAAATVAGDEFGVAVALSGDRALVGAPGAIVPGRTGLGTAHVFERVGDAWVEGATLSPDTLAEGEIFGDGVAIAADTAVIGSRNARMGSATVRVFTGVGDAFPETLAEEVAGESFGPPVAVAGDLALFGVGLGGPPRRGGSVVALARRDDVWMRETEFSNGRGTEGAEFGRSVAFDGRTVLIGAPRADVGDNRNQGAAFTFVLRDGIWQFEARLVKPGGQADEEFGQAVAIDGDTALVGPEVFERTAEGWAHIAHLGDGRGPNYGRDVALSGDTAVIGADGSVSAFTRLAGQWSPVAPLPLLRGRPTWDRGRPLALSGDRLLVGQPTNSVDGRVGQGQAQLLERRDGLWTLVATLTRPEGAENEGFGTSVALTDRFAFIGALHTANRPASVTVFALSDALWAPVQTLVDPSSFPFPDFAFDLAASDETLIISRVSHAEAQAYVLEGGAFTHFATLTQSPHPVFGISVAIHRDIAVVGSPYADDTELPFRNYVSGAAYLVSLRAQNGEPCFHRAACISGFCASGVCCDSECDEGPCFTCASPDASGACGVAADTTVCRPAGAPCDAAEFCDGVNPECPPDRLRASGESCRPPSCADGTATAEAVCSGDTSDCPPAITTTCAPLTCGADACEETRAEGAPCELHAQCRSGVCADGVCCDRACAGQCEACDTPAGLGQCSVVVGAPRADRPRCAGEGTPCAGWCDGVDSSACRLPGEETSCSEPACVQDHRRPGGRCDGRGGCSLAPLESCAALGCAHGECVRPEPPGPDAAPDAAPGAAPDAAPGAARDAAPVGDAEVSVPEAGRPADALPAVWDAAAPTDIPESGGDASPPAPDRRPLRRNDAQPGRAEFFDAGFEADAPSIPPADWAPRRRPSSCDCRAAGTRGNAPSTWLVAVAAVWASRRGRRVKPPLSAPRAR